MDQQDRVIQMTLLTAAIVSNPALTSMSGDSTLDPEWAVGRAFKLMAKIDERLAVERKKAHG